MLKKDEQGRIIQIDIDGGTSGGHSACNICNKDMPGVWDTVCWFCGKTLCYDHADVVGDKWACPQHVKENKK